MFQTHGVTSKKTNVNYSFINVQPLPFSLSPTDEANRPVAVALTNADAAQVIALPPIRPQTGYDSDI